MTHDLDLKRMCEQLCKESYQAGYNAALQEVARFINASLGRTLEIISIRRRREAGRPRLFEGSLAALVLNKIEAHPDGVLAIEIKDWLAAVREFPLRQAGGLGKTRRHRVNAPEEPLGGRRQERRWKMVSRDRGVRGSA